ncbi:MAG: ABC transporter ATP-binding protein, partial [Gammaproteobacteria bacterium]|nr:ABC transporter ATP-binding protein [Gammaproteobacteria bacterium]
MASLKLISELIVFISIITLLAITNFWATFMLSSLLMVVFLLYDTVVKKPFQEAGEETAKSSENIIKGVNEGVGGLKEIRVLGKSDYFHGKVKRAAYRYAEYGSKAQAMQNIPRHMLESAVISFIIILAVYSLYTQGEATSAMSVIGMFAVAAVRLMPSAYQMSVTFTSLRFSRHHMEELYQDLLDLSEYSCTSKAENHVVDENNGGQREFISLTMDNIYYQYPDASVNAIEGLDFRIEKGDCIGIIGKSGSGKTTLIDIILGLLIPQTGKVLLNNSPLQKKIDLWYEIVAYIPQDIYLIDESLRKNIALGIDDEYIEDNKIKEAISVAQLNQVAKDLPDGVNTILGENGIKLSGGQRQRVALARAIYHEREVIIMDEATSALD